MNRRQLVQYCKDHGIKKYSRKEMMSSLHLSINSKKLSLPEKNFIYHAVLGKLLFNLHTV